MEAQENIRRAVYDVFAAAVFVTLLTALMKDLSGTFSAFTVVFFRFFAPLIIALLPIVVSRNIRALKTHYFGLHVLRACALVASNYALFFTLMHLPLMDANLLYYTAPIFIPILAGLFLGEETNRRTWICLAISFVGVMLILKPGHDLFNPVSLIGLASGFFLAVNMTVLRRLTRTETTQQCIFYNLALCSLLSGVPLAAMGWEHVPAAHYTGIKGGAVLEVFLAVGITAWFTQVFVTKGYRLAPASIVGPFIYASIPLSAALDWLVWHHTPDAMTITGAILMVIGAVLIMRRNKPAHPYA